MDNDLNENELTGLEEHLRDCEYTGDPRRCPRHPEVVTSSADGMFDGVCGECENEADAATEAWAVDPTNAYRSECGVAVRITLEEDTRRHGVTCLDELEPDADDEICF